MAVIPVKEAPWGLGALGRKVLPYTSARGGGIRKGPGPWGPLSGTAALAVIIYRWRGRAPKAGRGRWAKLFLAVPLAAV